MPLVREHRGGLAESMETCYGITTRLQLLSKIRTSYNTAEIYVDDIYMHHYDFDKRINWDTWIIQIYYRGKLVVYGFSNGPIPR
jgi:hypothetical protein